MTLPEHAAYQARVVLRLRPGDSVTVFDGGGCEWPAELTRVDSTSVAGELGEAVFSDVEPACEVTLLLALVRPERFEMALQKATELGAWGFQPVVSSRVQASDVRAASPSRLARWRRIAREAAEQSGRLRAPWVGEPIALQEAVLRAAGDGAVLFLWEEQEAGTPGLRSVLRRLVAQAQPGKLAVVVGPVGGFEVAEVEDAKRAGAISASMGRRILRSETAAIAALTAIMLELGELGP